MNQCVGKNPKPRAFTLVELLVVIGIIGVLMAILLPALGRARVASARVACASNMRQIALGAANYAAAYKGYLPPYLGYPGAYTVANAYNVNNMKPLFDSKMLSTDKVKYCPTGPNGTVFGGRANYEFNPHNGTYTAPGGAAIDTWRWRKLQSIPKDRCLLVDVLYNQSTVSHWDGKGVASWNVCYPDGHVNIVPQKDVFNALAGRFADKWTRLNDYTRVLEMTGAGEDPKKGTGSYLWGTDKYDPIPAVAAP